MPDDRPTISTSRLSAGEVARHSFGIVRRGFDPAEVRSYLELVSRELAGWEQHEADLRHELSERLEEAANPVLDEATLSSALGQHSAQILRDAHEEAARIVLAAEENAAALLREAQAQANEVQVRTEAAAAQRVADAEIAATTVRQRTQEEVEALRAEATAAGEAMVERAREQGRAVLEKAQLARKRVLADLAQRRRTLGIQIEQFRAARDELAAAVSGVRGSVDTILEDLARADDDARAAAAAAAQRPVADLPAGDEEEQAEDLEEEAAPDEGRAPRPAPAVVAVFDDVDDGTLEPAPAPEPPADPGPTAPVPDHMADTGEVPAVRAAAPVPESPTSESPVTTVSAPGDGPGGAAPAEPATVDDLFARIRASHEGAEAPAEAGQAGLGDAAAEPVRIIEGPAPGGADESDAGLIELRAGVLDPVVTMLGRRLKRALQDDQNRLLEALRRGSGAWSDDLLVPEGQQQALFVDAAGDLLREAFTAGVGYTRTTGTVLAGPETDAKVVDPLAGDLAAGIVAQLRRRLLGDETADLGADATELVGAAYREWRGERIERLVGDYALGAFSAGVVASSAGPVRWVVTAVAACPDCDDNSLAGAVAPGEEFPTGHQYPPAHAGCRCLVAPTPS